MSQLFTLSVLDMLYITHADMMNLSQSFIKQVSQQFLPRCMECRRSLAMRFLSVRPSVCLSVRQTRAL